MERFCLLDVNEPEMSDLGGGNLTLSSKGPGFGSVTDQESDGMPGNLPRSPVKFLERNSDYFGHAPEAFHPRSLRVRWASHQISSKSHAEGS